MLERVLRAVAVVTAGRPSMRFVIVSTFLLLAVVLAMSAYLLVLRAWFSLRGRYRASRARLYQPAIEKVLMEEPYEAVLAALRPRRLGDGEVVQEIVVESMRYLEGAPFETLRRAATELGFVETNMRALDSWDSHRRGHALERLGLLHSAAAIPRMMAVLRDDRLDLKLVALRGLAEIGDPAVLPEFVAAAEKMPPGLLPRTASIMLQFGAPGRDAVRDLLNTRAADFPPASTPDILRQLSQDWGAS